MEFKNGIESPNASRKYSSTSVTPVNSFDHASAVIRALRSSSHSQVILLIKNITIL